MFFFGMLIVPLFIDYIGFKDSLEHEASLFIGSKVEVKGNVSARILPSPSITLNDIHIGQNADSSFKSRIERFSMDAELEPFLSGAIQISRMNIEKPNLNFRFSKKEHHNLFQGAGLKVPIHKIALENVRIKEGKINLIDQASNQSYFISDLNAEIFVHIFNLDPNFSWNSIKGSLRLEGSGDFGKGRNNFSLKANFPGEGSAIPVQLTLSPVSYPLIIDLSGNLRWDDEYKPIYGGVFSASGDFSRFLGIENSLGKANISGDFEFSNGNMRISSYKFEADSSLEKKPSRLLTEN
ncbi:AsmA family protein [Candidatus Liberibacter sp.]|uniref:AsmA family protein n=1 Tax=Candidatus Liberibacter sp. TaxID=34022 RepID=UPI0015F58E00|nr:AsmA family protein [Candidatus Liberibacter sp.]MBA5724034.1 AsmA family protein [Candidatus Liberibacter sp.]